MSRKVDESQVGITFVFYMPPTEGMKLGRMVYLVTPTGEIPSLPAEEVEEWDLLTVTKGARSRGKFWDNGDMSAPKMEFKPGTLVLADLPLMRAGIEDDDDMMEAAQ